MLPFLLIRGDDIIGQTTLHLAHSSDHLAHHCVLDHPASRILRDFYHPYLATGLKNVPAILGLTASPVVNKRAGKLE